MNNTLIFQVHAKADGDEHEHDVMLCAGHLIQHDCTKNPKDYTLRQSILACDVCFREWVEAYKVSQMEN